MCYIKCKFCKKEFKNSGVRLHEYRCKLNPDRPDLTGENNPHYGKKGSNQYIKAIENGTVYCCTEETKEKQRKFSLGRKFTDDQKSHKSDIMLEVVRKYPNSYRGRYNRGSVKTKILEGYELHGSWEEIVFISLRQQNIMPIKPKGFPYIFNEKTRMYFPDFYIAEYDVYIEVKGYETEKDLAKWGCFTEKLLILKSKEIKNILNGKNILEYLKMI